MERWMVLLAAACLAAGCRGSEPAGGDEWTAMSWNVQNLFDGNHDGAEYPEFDPSTGAWDERLYRRRLERAGRAVFDAVPSGPDLLVLQEIEHAGILDDLAEGPLRRGGYEWRLAGPGNGAIRCGVLSRHPLSETKAVECGSWRDRELRPALAFTVETPLGAVRVLALHWKSPRDGRAATEEARRMEALAVEALIEEAETERPGIGVLALGDLNTPGDGGIVPAALAPWEGFSRTGVPAILHRSSDAGLAGLREGTRILFDPEPSSGPPGTYWFRGGWDRPDRALMTEGMLDRSGPRFLECRTAGPPGGRSDERPERWVTDYEEGFSDHLPLILSFGESR